MFFFFCLHSRVKHNIIILDTAIENGISQSEGGVFVIIENTGLNGLVNDLAHLDKVTEQLGFVRWQWEYTRATYEIKY